jgi:solute carrier family 25 protein 39/40
MNMSIDKKVINCNNFQRASSEAQLHQQLVAASFGGAISAIVTCPFDVIKTRLQIAPNVRNPRFKQQVFSGTLDALLKIVRNEGVFALWRGLAPSLIMTVPNAAIYFNTYEALKKRITRLEFPVPSLVPLVSGALARVVAVTTLAPLELIRTNFQAQQKDRSVWSFVHKTGVRGMWLGVGATLSRDVPFSAIYWSCYEMIKSEVRSDLPQTTYGAFVTSFFSGAMSGMLSAILTTPIDLVKTRVQTGLHLPKSGKCQVAKPPPTARNIVMLIYKEEGFKGFMRGWVPRAVKVGPACAIMISSYELIKSLGATPDPRCGG